VRLRQSGPSSVKTPRRNCSGTLAGANALRAFSAASRKPTVALARHSPSPGRVTMSTEMKPASWFSAAKALRRKRISRICDFGGSAAPRKPLTRMTAPGPAICSIACAISSGSSGRSAISRSVSEVVKASPRGSLPASRRSRPTVSSSKTAAMGNVSVRRVVPARSVWSTSSTASKPGASALIV
jgi:hypothetical protein